MPRGGVGATSRRPLAAEPLTPVEIVSTLVALVTVAVAQPLLDLIGRNASFLVAHDATRADVVLVAVGLTVLLPLLLAAPVLLLRAVHADAAHLLQVAWVTLLVVLLALVVARRVGPAPAVAALPLALGVGVAGGALYHRSRGVRRSLAWLALTAPAVAVFFVVGTPASTLVFGDAAAASVGGLEDPPHVVVAVFDELPVASLLTADGEIDAAAFPAFARLAADSTFFRNATGVAGQTSDAIPAALSGRYARLDALPVAADHPDNLFSLLDGPYDLHVVEPLTELCPPGECRRAGSLSERYSALLGDLAVVAAHTAAPPELARGLPPVDHGWRDFRGEATALGKEVAVRDRFRAAREEDPAAAFEDFIDRIEATQRPMLHFMHSLLPHRPWVYLADGRSYAQTRAVPGMELGRWLDDEWPIWHSYQRHLVQTQLADRLLGRLLDRLEREAMYDDALVIVMADHGVSFTPETSMRVLERGTFGEIAAVPLFVKRPRQESGGVSDRPVETIDVLPTVLDVLGAPTPAGVDGRSLFDDGPPRTSKRFDNPEGTLTFTADGDEKWPVVARKQRLFSHDGPLPYPYDLAPRDMQTQLGEAVADDLGTAPGLRVTLDAPPQGVDAPAALVSGAIATDGAVTPAAIAIAVDGRIQAVTLPDEQDRFHAFLPPDALPEELSEVAVLAVTAQGLARITQGP